MDKLNIKAYAIEGKNNDEILTIITKFPFYMNDKEANSKKRKRWVVNPESLSGEMISKLFINDDIIIGYSFKDEIGGDLHLHYLERELQFVDVYEFSFFESHLAMPFIKKIIKKEPLQFHWQNTNTFHEKYAHPFFKNVLGFKNTDFMIRPEDIGMGFPYRHPEFRDVKEKVLLIENLYFKKSHLIAYKVFNPLTYEHKVVWSIDFLDYLSQLKPMNSNL
ncbi:hypothetical protein LZZ90_12725 [Flavobacterium sp. SM15]|uniref:hypothetical protein n=1 Tax=Flavobacterium sp. SM15 TaxID=2908005 RepID=UPI001EDA2913|nr:hypothetical protein [Flavobacterium sp. SM15]MCG2612372.1 hypothetical protein [Flavobacterium sp. SM15]